MFIFTPYIYLLGISGSLVIIILTFLKIFFFLTSDSSYFCLTISPFFISQVSIDISILFTTISCLFSAVVAFISAVVFFFIGVYFQSWTKITYFCWFTIAFVLCILILINFNDFFFVILGWDGLGVSSYFLILYFQSPSRVYSGAFTVLINRLGDCFLVLFIVMWWSTRINTHFILESNLSNSFFSFLLFIALSTKSALFPFSPWLPAAIAAPTPISSLVHSSTLVTAGLFLLIQNSSILLNNSLSYFILITCLFTSLYAGVSALLESDLKKVVALSTLSHLGFIGTRISLSLPHLAFFHLLTHAFFKSSLFISVGVFIISHGHYQDSRRVTSIYPFNPFFSSVILVREANLLGLPFMSGFYSKDLILELSQYSSIGSFLTFILYTNVFLTFSYSLRVLLSLSIKNNNSPFFLSSNSTLFSSKPFIIILCCLRLVRVVFGFLFSKLAIQSEVSLPAPLKILAVLILVVTLLLFFLNKDLFFRAKNNPLSYFISSIIFLSPLWTNMSSRLFISYSNKILLFEESFIKHLLVFFLQKMLKLSSNLATHTFISLIQIRRKVYWLTFGLFVVCLLF